MEASNNEPRTPLSESATLVSRPSQPNPPTSFPTVSSLSPKPEGQRPSGTTHIVTDDEFTCPSDELPPPYPVHEEDRKSVV